MTEKRDYAEQELSLGGKSPGEKRKALEKIAELMEEYDIDIPDIEGYYIERIQKQKNL